MILKLLWFKPGQFFMRYGERMRYPEFLKNKDTIGYVAPAFGCNREPYKSAFENALMQFEERGYGSELGPNVYKEDGVGISTSPVDCGKELEQYYCADTNKAIISCGGGELMCETISNIDFDKIAQAKPKWYMGFSDNTNFTFLLTTLCDTASIYGPNAPKFGMIPWHESLEDAMKVLDGSKLTVNNYDKWEKESLRDEEHPYEPFNLTEETILRGFAPKAEKAGNSVELGVSESGVATGQGMLPAENIKMRGRLIGGCMDCLVNLTGTRFDKVSEFLEKYKEDGFIWFLECCDLNTFSMRRAMWQMKEAGWFKYCKGFLIGRPMHFDEPLFGLDRFGAILNTVEEIGVPAVMDLDIGHISPSMPLVCGSMADVRYEHGNISINMELL